MKEEKGTDHKEEHNGSYGNNDQEYLVHYWIIEHLVICHEEKSYLYRYTNDNLDSY